MRRLIRIGREALREILGLVPFQSQTQYLEGFLRAIAKRKYSGNPFPLYFLFISTLFPLPAVSAGTVEI